MSLSVVEVGVVPEPDGLVALVGDRVGERDDIA
jgi:hypothetical protein